MNHFRHFAKTRRGAIAVIMALSLAPLMFLIGIAIDFTFLSQDRTQTAFAAQAAATQATRVAAATYSFEVAQGNSSLTSAAKIAIDDANIEGNLWYNAELGGLTRGTTGSPSTNTTYGGNTDGTLPAGVAPNFVATVSDNTSYPPIFNPLFGRTSPWAYTSKAVASTESSYAQILLMLDTSNSMLIGADQSDIQTMADDSVCPKFGYIAIASGLSDMHNHQNFYAYQTGDNDQIYFNSQVPQYPGTSVSDQTKTCNSGYGTGSAQGGLVTSGTAAINACALACHSTTTTYTDNNPPSGMKSGTFYADSYGMARREGVTLRLDVVLSATEQVIQDMASSESLANQLSVGVFQFNSDVGAIAIGSNYGQANGDTRPEATTNLTNALNAVEAVDYNYTPSETAIPPLVYDKPTNSTLNMSASPPTDAFDGNTNFSKLLADLIAGNATGGSADALTASGDGSTPTKARKFMFIVTDGMQDSGPTNGGGESNNRVIGDMTNIAAEKTALSTGIASTSAVCSTLKITLGYTVYVLYVTYYPLANGPAYYQAVLSPTAATVSDYPSYSSASPQTLSEVSSESAPQKYTDSPTAQALKACASTTSDFYQASSSSDIQTALSDMLKSALASTIRLTN